VRTSSIACQYITELALWRADRRRAKVAANGRENVWSAVMEVPFDRLGPDVLRALIREFVSRDGTDYGEHEIDEDRKIAQVEALLKKREVIVVFDAETETCNIIRR
jgi:uncharacterized protein YheU (UPF0270 family)